MLIGITGSLAASVQWDESQGLALSYFPLVREKSTRKPDMRPLASETGLGETEPQDDSQCTWIGTDSHSSARE